MESKWTVLLADASEEFRGLLMAALAETEEFEVVASVGDGAEAARLAEEKQPDLVVMDMILPGLDGLGLLDQLSIMKEKRPEVIVRRSYGARRLLLYDKALPDRILARTDASGADADGQRGWAGRGRGRRGVEQPDYFDHS